jgi:hypothetical protein
MLYAVTKNTISARAIADIADLTENEVAFEGELSDNAEFVWDSSVNNIRLKDDDDFCADERQKLKEEIDTLTANKIAAIFGFSEKSLDVVIKQLNFNTLIDYLKDQALNRTLSPQELATIETGRAYFERITALRVYGKYRSELVDTSDPKTFDVAVGWPE